MALNFDELTKPQTKKSASFLYTDLTLDFAEVIDSATGKRDAGVDRDILAVRNSVVNIFSTNRGENLLLPDFGSNLRAILFEPISERNAKRIGDIMLSTIRKYEPRVVINSVKIFPDPDALEYAVSLALAVRGFNEREIKLSGIFSETTFNLK